MVASHIFPGGSDGKASVYNVEDLGSIPRSGRFPGEGNGLGLSSFLLIRFNSVNSTLKATRKGRNEEPQG